MVYRAQRPKINWDVVPLLQRDQELWDYQEYLMWTHRWDVKTFPRGLSVKELTVAFLVGSHHPAWDFLRKDFASLLLSLPVDKVGLFSVRLTMQTTVALLRLFKLCRPVIFVAGGPLTCTVCHLILFFTMYPPGLPELHLDRNPAIIKIWQYDMGIPGETGMWPPANYLLAFLRIPWMLLFKTGWADAVFGVLRIIGVHFRHRHSLRLRRRRRWSGRSLPCGLYPKLRRFARLTWSMPQRLHGVVAQLQKHLRACPVARHWRTAMEQLLPIWWELGRLAQGAASVAAAPSAFISDGRSATTPAMLIAGSAAAGSDASQRRPRYALCTVQRRSFELSRVGATEGSIVALAASSAERRGSFGFPGRAELEVVLFAHGVNGTLFEHVNEGYWHGGTRYTKEVALPEAAFMSVWAKDASGQRLVCRVKSWEGCPTMDFCGPTELRVLCPMPPPAPLPLGGQRRVRPASRFELTLSIWMPRIRDVLVLPLSLCLDGSGAGTSSARKGAQRVAGSKPAARDPVVGRRGAVGLAACTPPLHARGRMEKHWPGLVHQWLRYHTETLGVELFRLYDLDGSFELPVQRLVSAGKVEYVPRFAHAVHPSHFGSAVTSCPLCSEILVYQDCLVNLRGRARWVLNLGSPNKWVRPGARLSVPGAFGAFMHELHAAGWSAAHLSKVHFVPSAKTGSRYTLLPAHFRQRALAHVRNEVVPLADPACTEVLSMHGLIVRPCAADPVAGGSAKAGVGEEVVRLSLKEWFVNHYVDVLLSGRCAQSGSCYSADTGVLFDRGMMWLVPQLRNWTQDYLQWLGEDHLFPILVPARISPSNV